MKYYIYVLKDPTTNDVKYVGQTWAASQRLSAHLADKNKSDKAGWIQSLKSLGLKPNMEIIEECVRENRHEREAFHIKSFRESGVVLLNWVRPKAQKPKERKEHIPRLSLSRDAYQYLLTASSISGEKPMDVAERVFKIEAEKQVALKYPERKV